MLPKPLAATQCLNHDVDAKSHPQWSPFSIRTHYIRKHDFNRPLRTRAHRARALASCLQGWKSIRMTTRVWEPLFLPRCRGCNTDSTASSPSFTGNYSSTAFHLQQQLRYSTDYHFVFLLEGGLCIAFLTFTYPTLASSFVSMTTATSTSSYA